MMTPFPRGTSCAILVLGALAACSGPPQPPANGLLGVGTPGVESYMAPSQATSLAALQQRCRTVPAAPGALPAPQTLEAACDQLRRTMHNQPGTAISRAAGS